MVTDTAFRNSSLGKLFLEKIVCTFKHWPYHTDLLVFCFEFRLSPVCENLNYYYNITDDCLVIQEKSKQGGWGHIFFKKNSGFFRFVTLPSEILDKTKLSLPLEIP